MKKKWLVVASFVFLFVTFNSVAHADNPIRIVVNGIEIKPDISPCIIDGHPMVPIRYMAEFFDHVVRWDPGTQTVSIFSKTGEMNGKYNYALKEKIRELKEALDPQTNNNLARAEYPIKIVVKGIEVKPDVSPCNINGSIMVPIRLVADLFDQSGSWAPGTNTILFHTKTGKMNWMEYCALEMEIKKLEESLIPKTPQQAVNNWARGVKMRNNLLQKSAFDEYFEKIYSNNYIPFWINMLPNTWIEDFMITKETKVDDRSWEYEVQFDIANTDGIADKYTSKVLVRESHQSWHITYISSDDLGEQLKLRIQDFQANRYSGMGMQQLDINLESLSVYNIELFNISINNNKVTAYLKTVVTHQFSGYPTSAEWPEQKGRIKYLETNKQNLSTEQIQKIQEKINFYNKEIQKNIENQKRTVEEYFLIRGTLDETNRIVEQSLSIYIQNPWNSEEYIGLSPLPLKEELKSRGYIEMLHLVNQ